MNEIITKLNEIEEKAETILRDAEERKEELHVQLAQSKRDIEAEYDKREAEAMQQLEKQLTDEAMQKLADIRRKQKEALERFDVKFSKEKEQLAEQIMQSVIK